MTLLQPVTSLKFNELRTTATGVDVVAGVFSVAKFPKIGVSNLQKCFSQPSKWLLQLLQFVGYSLKSKNSSEFQSVTSFQTSTVSVTFLLHPVTICYNICYKSVTEVNAVPVKLSAICNKFRKKSTQLGRNFQQKIL